MRLLEFLNPRFGYLTAKHFISRGNILVYVYEQSEDRIYGRGEIFVFTLIFLGEQFSYEDNEVQHFTTLNKVYIIGK